MIFIVIGIIVLVIGIITGKNESPVKPYNGLLKIIGIIIILLGISLSSVKQIEP
jgi:disulfide bond formation protein DsbB